MTALDPELPEDFDYCQVGGIKIGSLFSGVGGLDMAVEAFFNAETAWHCEWDEEPSKVLAARWPGVPNHRDVTAVDWTAVEPVDIMCGGFPCQDVSLAGRRRGMKEGTRSGLWSEFARAIDIVKPKVVVIENVRGLISADAGGDVEPCPWCMGDGADEYHLRALDAVLADLSDLGFDAEWTGLRAADVGAPHGRFRFFLVAYTRGLRLEPGWSAVTREAAGGWAPTVTSGRVDSPVALLGTPRVSSGNGAGDLGRRQALTNLESQVLLLPTPIVSDGTGGPKNLNGALYSPQLREIGQLLPTPVASEADKGGPGQKHGNGDATLSGTVRDLLPTPTVGNATGGNARRGGARAEESLLPGIAREASMGLLPTPRASRGAAATETMYKLGAERDDTGDRQGNVVGQVNWGQYEPAVRLWESITRPAPPPTLPDGKNGNHRLAAVFPEWMMGYPAGWITDVIARNPAIKASGNGVVPQQAYAALTILWARILDVLTREVAA